MRKIVAILLVAVLLLCGCGEKAEEAEQTTVSGMVVSVDGTKVELISTDTLTGGNRFNRGENSENGERPTMPEGETRPQGGFGGQRPNWSEGDFTMPEGATVPEGFEGFAGFGEGNTPSFGGSGRPDFGGQRPEGFDEGQMPTMPEGMTGGGNRFNREDMETTTVDLADAHISLELEDGSKAAGSMSDITVGSRLTITMEGDKAVRVIVSQSGFGGKGGFTGTGFGGQGGFGGNRGERPSRDQQP